jgi:hypothetical protein
VIDTIVRALTGNFVVFAQHHRQLQLLEVVGQQHLRRAAGRARGHRLIVSLSLMPLFQE